MWSHTLCQADFFTLEAGPKSPLLSLDIRNFVKAFVSIRGLVSASDLLIEAGQF